LDKNRSFFIILAVLLLTILLTACNVDQKEGKFVGFMASYSLQDAVEGGVDDLYFHGTVSIELKDGNKISAIIEENLLQELKGHDMVIIKKIEPIEVDGTKVGWKVIDKKD
jgi:hypothetical protein